MAVLSPVRSNGSGLSLLEEVEPKWAQVEEFCLRCNVERDEGWCDVCKGRRCRDCGQCGCLQPVENPLCPECGLRNPRDPGARFCVDCVADGIA